MNVLITGGLGFIGSNLAKKCVDMGHDVSILDSLDPNSGGNLFNIYDIQKKVKIISADISIYEDILESVKNCELIFNCAASTSHLQSMKTPWENLSTNAKGVMNILEAIRRHNPMAKLIHISTTTQMGKLNYEPADESHSEFPTDIYSANKMVSEKYCLIYSNAFGIQSVVLRLCNVFGPRAAINSPNFTFNNYFIGLAMQNMLITVYKPGTQLRNILYVDDVVDALLAASTSSKAVGKSLLAVGDQHYSVKKIAEKTCKIMGGRLRMIDWPKDRELIEIGNATFTNKEIKKILKWEPKISLTKGLNLTKDYFHDKLEKYIK